MRLDQDNAKVDFWQLFTSIVVYFEQTQDNSAKGDVRFELDPLTLDSFVYIVPIHSRSLKLLLSWSTLSLNHDVPSNTHFAFRFHNREVATSGASALSSYTSPKLVYFAATL